MQLTVVQAPGASGSRVWVWQRSLDGVVDAATVSWLAGYRFSGDMWGYAEGEIYFAHSPLLIVEASFAEAVVLETVLLSIYNHDSAIASAASGAVDWRRVRMSEEMPETPSRPDRR